MTDRELLAKFNANRDHEAFAELVRRHADLVYATAHRQLPHAAEDVMQAVFLILSRKAPQLTGHHNLASWLYRVTQYCCRNVRRGDHTRHHHEREAGMRQVQVELAPSAPPPAELSALLDAGLERLRTPERAAVLLRYLEQKTFAETGSALGIGQEAAKKRAQRGLDKLRAYFAGRGFAVPGTAVIGVLTGASLLKAPAGAVAAIAGVTAGAGAASTAAAGIAKGAAAMMKLAMLKVAAIVTVAAMVAGTGVLVAAQRMRPVQAQPSTVAAGGGTSNEGSGATALPTRLQSTTSAAAKTLEKELRELEEMRVHENVDFAAVDRKAQDMLQRWKAEGEQGDIYYVWEQVYAQSGLAEHVAEVERLATKALELQKHPAKRAILYGDWGGALTIKTPPKERDDAAVRARVAKPFFMGLEELSALDLPEVVPEPPVVAAQGGQIGDGPGERAVPSAQLAAQEKAILLTRLINYRKAMVGLAVSVYVDWAYTGKGPEIEELRKVATESLTKKGEVDRIMMAAAKRVEKRAATEKIWQQNLEKEKAKAGGGEEP